MGWVSLLEDAIKRFESDLHQITTEEHVRTDDIAVDQLKAAHEVLARGQTILYEALKHLELATDPSIELAALIRTIETELNAQKSQLWEYRKTCESLAKALNKERIRAEKMQTAYEEMKREKNRLEKKLDVALKQAPGAIYDAYSKGFGNKDH
jgi:predicted RNase H-like nuclease (RuvC/YqgF family)